VARLRASDLILHAGDLSSLAFLEELRGLGPPVEAVAGNADEVALKAELPVERVVGVEGVRIGMAHVPGPAAGRAERLVRRFPGCDAVVFGHTHVAVAERVGGVWILNPGSPTERRRASRGHSMLELRIDGREIEPLLVEFSAQNRDVK
jgi:putative phosphoesterase